MLLIKNGRLVDPKSDFDGPVDILIEGARKTSNTFMLETAKLIKAALINNQHSEKPVSELDVLHKMVKEREKAMAIYEKAGRKDLALKEVKEIGYIRGIMPVEPSEQEIDELIAELMKIMTLTIKDTKMVITHVQRKFPTVQKSTIVRIFKSFL